MRHFTIVALATIAMTNAFASSAVNSNNKLGLKLGLETAKVLKNQNYMVSPVSLQQALTLAANGSARGTRSEIESLLGADLESLNASSKKLVDSISFSVEQKKRMQRENSWVNPSVVAISNSIWNTNGATDGRIYEYSESFKAVAREFYGSAAPVSLDFKKPEAAKAINKWAEEKTYGLVKHIITADVLNPMLWVVINASYIEAAWQTPFHEMSDAPKFALANRSLVDAKMITGKQVIGHVRHEDGSQVASIPFASAPGAPKLDFIVYLPSEKAELGKSQEIFFDEQFIKKSLSDIDSQFQYSQAKVVLPKFSFDTSLEMKNESPLTKAMGLKFLFENTADFSLMATAASAESKVGLIKQNGRIELDEKGVKAAAVTIIGGIERTSIPVEPTLQLVVNRPFMFAIVERTTNAILFTGTVVDPR